MQINGLQQSSAIQSVNGPQHKPFPGAASAGAAAPSAADHLDLSPEAQAISAAQAGDQTQATTGIRQDKVDAIRQALANGSYETTEKLSAALDRMLDTFA